MYIESNDNKLAIKLLEEKKIPYYLMTKEEFSKIIKFYNNRKTKIINDNYKLMTWEQIERLIKEVNNQLYINKDTLVNELYDKKYKKLIEYSGKDLTELKKVLNDMYNEFEKYSPDNSVEILIYILKINKMLNISDMTPLEHFLQHKKKNKKKDYNYFKSRISIPIINITNINLKKFIDDLLIDFFIQGKANVETFDD